MAPYGRGKPVALAFDLPASLNLANGGQIPAANSPLTLPQKRWDAALTELLAPRQSVARSSYVPNEPVHIPLTLDNQSSQPRTVQLEVELPSGAQWLGLDALRLPAGSGTHVVRTSVLSIASGTIIPQALAQQENRYMVRTLDERFNLLKQSINNWNSSAGASWLELTALKTHFLLLDQYYRLGQWELALLQAGHISDDLAAMRSTQDSKITANRIELDELMRGLQIRWYLQRKSTTQSYRSAIYYVDLTVRDGISLNEAIQQARQYNQQRQEAGFDQITLNQAVRNRFDNGLFEFSDDEAGYVLEEFYADIG